MVVCMPVLIESVEVKEALSSHESKNDKMQHSLENNFVNMDLIVNFGL